MRLLANIFRLGLFENPYLDVQTSARIVGNPSYMQAGYEAQLKSIVMLKNKNGILPLKPGSTEYIPQRYTPPGKDWFGNPTPETLEYPLNLEIAAKYFKVTDNPDEADFALVCIRSPKSGTGYSQEDADNGGNGYVPISLQYKPYTAVHARKRSLAGDVCEGEAQNRSYYGKTATTHNEADLDALLDTAERMKGKPVIVSLLLSTPAVIAEFEAAADGIIVHFGVQDQALLDVMTGAAEPSGLLPMQMPANMRTVEEQLEDAAHDMECHIDSERHRYDFGFGLNWGGVIQDSRTGKYKQRSR